VLRHTANLGAPHRTGSCTGLHNAPHIKCFNFILLPRDTYIDIDGVHDWGHLLSGALGLAGAERLRRCVFDPLAPVRAGHIAMRRPLAHQHTCMSLWEVVVALVALGRLPVRGVQRGFLWPAQHSTSLGLH
jgi:hypothetical protein